MPLEYGMTSGDVNNVPWSDLFLNADGWDCPAGCQNRWYTNSGGMYPPKQICFCGVENYGLVLSSVMVQHRVDLYQMNLSSLLKVRVHVCISYYAHMELVEKITVKAQVDQTFASRENRFCLVELDAVLWGNAGCPVCKPVISVDYHVASSTGVKFSCYTGCLDKCSLLHVKVSWLHRVDVILMCRVEVDSIAVLGC